jgi:hypothetical protein
VITVRVGSKYLAKCREPQGRSWWGKGEPGQGSERWPAGRVLETMGDIKVCNQECNRIRAQVGLAPVIKEATAFGLGNFLSSTLGST